MENEIKRGEVYWVSVDDSVGFEIQTGRPAVVVSGDKSNSTLSTVIVAYMTSSATESHAQHVKVYVDGKYSTILCNQVRTVDKRRLTKRVAVLDDSTMSRVSGALAVSMCIPTYVKKPSFVDKDAGDSEESLTLKVELDVLKKMYDKVVNQLVEMRVEADINRAKVESVVIEAEPIIEDEIEDESRPTMVELNTCTRADLVQLGLDATLVNNIFKHRPYKTTNDLRIVPGMTSSMWNIMKGRVTCIPIVKKKPDPVIKDSGKVNVNTATVEDFVGMGLGEQTSIMIIRYRNRNGKFNSISDLAEIPRFGPGLMKRFGDKMEV